MRARPVLTLLLSLGLVGCGGGAGQGGEETIFANTQAAAFVIQTESLPTGHALSAYPETQLVLTAPTPEHATWSVQDGALPDGLSLLPDGRVMGTPTQSGMWVFEVRAQQGRDVALKRLGIAIDTMGVFAQEGTTGARGWTDAPVRLCVAGASGEVFFTADGETGGSLVQVNGAVGAATYLPGAQAGIDTITVSDVSGALATLELTIATNPLAHRDAQFGTSDVWYLDAEAKNGSHEYATDFHAALATMRLRDPASVTATGSTADDLAATWVLLETHRRLNQHFGRNADGSKGSGVDIAFAWKHPAAPHTTATPGTRIDGAVHRFSVMALVSSNGEALAGRALVDDEGNTSHEHNAPSDHSQLGVFVDAIARSSEYVASTSTLAQAPIRLGDEAILSALIHGETLPDSNRARAIRTVGEALAQALAKVLAHEIAHSVGLTHTNPPTPGSLMNPMIDIYPGAELTFTAADWVRLRTDLPGPARTTAQALQALHQSSVAPVCGCGLRN